MDLKLRIFGENLTIGTVSLIAPLNVFYYLSLDCLLSGDSCDVTAFRGF